MKFSSLLYAAVCCAVAGFSAFAAGEPPRFGDVCSPTKRQCVEFHFEEVADTSGMRQKYPFLVGFFDELEDRRVHTGMDAPRSAVLIGTIGQHAFRTGGDILFVRIVDVFTCGTSGCSSEVFEQTNAGGFESLLKVASHGGSPIYLSACGTDISLLMPGGHGVSISIAEWKYTGDSFDYVESYKDADRIPKCEK